MATTTIQINAKLKGGSVDAPSTIAVNNQVIASLTAPSDETKGSICRTINDATKKLFVKNYRI